MRRSSVSIPSNIEEGQGRNSTKKFLRFLQIAIGSLYELQTQLVITKKLIIFSEHELVSLEENARKTEQMMSSFIRKLST